jgi:hypothetical protein
MIIGARFNGPPASANGGYTCGLVASYVESDGAVQVTLLRPPPLETPLSIVDVDGGVQVLGPNGGLIADGVPAELAADTDPGPAVPFSEAVAASAGYRGFQAHPFPTCFVCGPAREDGLRLFPGPLPDGRTATPWRVPDDVTPVLVWAALDCPGGWSVPLEARPYVLGRLVARVHRVPAPGDECVVMGRMVGEEGRKAYAQTALYSPTGAVLAQAHATWFALVDP